MAGNLWRDRAILRATDSIGDQPTLPITAFIGAPVRTQIPNVWNLVPPSVAIRIFASITCWTALRTGLAAIRANARIQPLPQSLRATSERPIDSFGLYCRREPVRYEDAFDRISFPARPT